MKITVIAVGKLRGPEAELCDEYKKRIKNASVREVVGATAKAEGEALLKAIPAKAFVVLCDERGKDLSSREFASKLAAWQERASEVIFVIGGADGVDEELRERTEFTLGFGRQTWPHRLARVMLLEQIYRAQQINAGHPYHRD